MYLAKPKLYFLAVISVTILIIIFSLKWNNDEDVYVKLIESYSLAEIGSSNTPKEKLFNIDFEFVLNNDQLCEKRFKYISIIYCDVIFRKRKAPADKYTNQMAIEDESRKFGDIIQGNFIEAYKNLTYKHIMGLKWAKDYCYNAKFIIKMDDDIVVNMDRIPGLLTSFKIPKTGYFLAGYILNNMIPIREPKNKWYVTAEEYNQNDLYVTGILAKKLKVKQFDISSNFAVHSEFIDCCIQDVRDKNLDCDILIGPNGGSNNLFYEFQ
ncbi:hypothetical protein NQ318_015754 [Aromia moschata]|uniref:Hexosyltransferase n=1 Tax=Aromia moschata TaxID=1265417 RepID=A0AAV8XPH2_9CUCU|nr:hypothetical protein NQ318_015754 [Aromia moschata]